MEEGRLRSKHPVINHGYFQGLQEEVHKRTGITRPVIIKAIRDNDTSSPKKLQVIKTALSIIAERGQNRLLMEEPDSEYNYLNLNELYTYADYLKWKFLERVELIKGKVFKMAPAPNSGHQTVSVNLVYEIVKLFYGQPCRVFSAPFDVRLPIPNALKDSTVVQPDICIVCDETKIDTRGCNGPPDLVVEILSASNQQHDLHRKFEIYELSGVKEYWIIDPSNRTVFIYYLHKGKFLGLQPFTLGMNAQSVVFKELVIPVDNIFYRIDFDQ